MTHPHKELIIALLDDPTLEVEEYNSALEKWFAFETKTQSRVLPYIINNHGRQFRVKEKPKPDVVRYGRARIDWLDKQQDADNNVKFTFSADGTLKNAEVL